ncbi:MAG: hypothetical protein AAF639_18845 [Chloroflexota bacterium]
MNPSQTLTLPEVPTQVPLLWFNQTAPTKSPLWLRTPESAEPFAVIIEASEFQRQELHRFQREIANLMQWLDHIELQLGNEPLLFNSIKVLKENTRQLWTVAPKAVRGFVAALTLSVKKLDVQTLSKGQVAALRYVLETVRSGEVDEKKFEEAHHLLVDNQIAPAFSFSRDLVQLYLDEV